METNKPTEITIPDMGKYRAELNRLSAAQYRNYLRNAPIDLYELKNLSRWLKENARGVDKIAKKFEGKKKKLKEPLILGTVTNVLSNLNEIKQKFRDTIELFETEMKRNKGLIKRIKSYSTLTDACGETHNIDESIARLAELFGGATKLLNEFKRTPSLLPPGMKEIPTIGAIRQRIIRYNKNS